MRCLNLQQQLPVTTRCCPRRWDAWFTALIVKVAARPYGVKSFRLALWENPGMLRKDGQRDFAQVVRAGLSEDWHPSYASGQNIMAIGR